MEKNKLFKVTLFDGSSYVESGRDALEVKKKALKKHNCMEDVRVRQVDNRSREWRQASSKLNNILNKRREKGANLFDVIRGLSRKLILKGKSLGLNKLAGRIHANAVEHGFWPAGRSDAECIALMHSELSEALEACREPMLPDYPYAYITKHTPGRPPRPAGIAEEMADTIIRILDFSGARHIDIDRAVREKMAYNKSRPYKHGKNF
jgi:hypothetical protein